MDKVEYRAATAKLPLPKGVATGMRCRTYADTLSVTKASPPVTGYVVVHVPTGLMLCRTRQRVNALMLVRDLLHSGMDLSFTSTHDVAGSVISGISQRVRFWNWNGSVPESTREDVPSGTNKETQTMKTKSTKTTKTAAPKVETPAPEKSKGKRAPMVALFKCRECGHLIYTEKEALDAKTNGCMCCGSKAIKPCLGASIPLRDKKRIPDDVKAPAAKAPAAKAPAAKAPAAKAPAAKAPAAKDGPSVATLRNEYSKLLQENGGKEVNVEAHDEAHPTKGLVHHAAYSFWVHTKESKEAFAKMGLPITVKGYVAHRIG